MSPLGAEIIRFAFPRGSRENEIDVDKPGWGFEMIVAWPLMIMKISLICSRVYVTIPESNSVPVLSDSVLHNDVLEKVRGHFVSVCQEKAILSITKNETFIWEVGV